jgi:hypothetical protein
MTFFISRPQTDFNSKLACDWTLDLLNVVCRLGKAEFKNENVYAFTGELE